MKMGGMMTKDQQAVQHSQPEQPELSSILRPIEHTKRDEPDAVWMFPELSEPVPGNKEAMPATRVDAAVGFSIH